MNTLFFTFATLLANPSQYSEMIRLTIDDIPERETWMYLLTEENNSPVPNKNVFRVYNSDQNSDMIYIYYCNETNF